jgi:acyl-CoA synthetase (AMP-forming)/AMP-acid ligase II
VDEDGYFWFEARADDIILSSGYNIAGPEVESALLEHAAIAECAVVGAPDKERGTVVRACVVLREGFEGSSALTKELQDFLRGFVDTDEGASGFRQAAHCTVQVSAGHRLLRYAAEDPDRQTSTFPAAVELSSGAAISSSQLKTSLLET